MQLGVAVLGAFAAAAWTATHPTNPVAPTGTVSVSWSNVVFAAIVGGGVVLALFYGGAGLYETIRYRFRGDKFWEATSDPNGPRATFVHLRPKVEPPEPVPRGLECAVKIPSGSVERLRIGRGDAFPNGSPFLQLADERFSEPGRYEVRWYGLTDRRKVYEIARAEFEVRSDT